MKRCYEHDRQADVRGAHRSRGGKYGWRWQVAVGGGMVLQQRYRRETETVSPADLFQGHLKIPASRLACAVR